MSGQQIHFVTGRLAEPSLRRMLARLAGVAGFGYTVQVMPITVAALMTMDWLKSRLEIPPGTTHVLLPGYCRGDLADLNNRFQVPIGLGPRDVARLPAHFQRAATLEDYGQHDIEIIAEINHANRMTLAEILAMAKAFQRDGADVIDLGCTPGEVWSGIGETVRALRGEGFRLSVDSLVPEEIIPAAKAGAELVLSINSGNKHIAPDLGCEVVVIPDEPSRLAGFAETIDFLAGRGVPMRLDPVLEPIGFGFANSLNRYMETRRKYPDAEIMMGIGNLTELTDADSAGVNVLLLGYCQESGIRSVLTTQVIPWAQTAVRECDLARRLVFHSLQHHVLPKHLEPRLIPLRGDAPTPLDVAALDELAKQIKDHNFRLYAAEGKVHAVSAGLHLADDNPWRLFAAMQQGSTHTLDAAHAFYLGYEIAKAITALTLGKSYQQDEPLNWGFLTRDEPSGHSSRIPEADAEEPNL
jgi:dihydropteroate synthase